MYEKLTEQAEEYLKMRQSKKSPFINLVDISINKNLILYYTFDMEEKCYVFHLINGEILKVPESDEVNYMIELHL